MRIYSSAFSQIYYTYIIQAGLTTICILYESSFSLLFKLSSQASFHFGWLIRLAKAAADCQDILDNFIKFF